MPRGQRLLGRTWLGALIVIAATLLLVSCGGSYGEPESETPAATQAEAEGTPAEEARVQVIRGRASLGDPDAPVVIQDYSDFL